MRRKSLARLRSFSGHRSGPLTTKNPTVESLAADMEAVDDMLWMTSELLGFQDLHCLIAFCYGQDCHMDLKFAS